MGSGQKSLGYSLLMHVHRRANVIAIQHSALPRSPLESIGGTPSRLVWNEWGPMEKPTRPWLIVSLKGTMETMGRDPQINGLQTIPRYDSSCKMNYFKRGNFFKPSKKLGKAWGGGQNRGGLGGAWGDLGGRRQGAAFKYVNDYRT